MNDQITAINHDPNALALHTEWELLDPVLDLRPMTSDELRRLMAFEPAEMLYSSSPCAPFARSIKEKGGVQP